MKDTGIIIALTDVKSQLRHKGDAFSALTPPNRRQPEKADVPRMSRIVLVRQKEGHVWGFGEEGLQDWGTGRAGEQGRCCSRGKGGLDHRGPQGKWRPGLYGEPQWKSSQIVN